MMLLSGRPFFRAGNMLAIAAELVQPLEQVQPPEFDMKIAVFVPLAAKVRGV
jgi:hypothetical protein